MKLIHLTLSYTIDIPYCFPIHGSCPICVEPETPEDVVLGYKTSLDAQILDSQLPQTTSDKWKEYQDWLNEPPEISDEEIEELLFHHSNEYAYGFKNAIKWYREQLKCRGNNSTLNSTLNTSSQTQHNSPKVENKTSHGEI
jgi:hypothetical protein